MREPIVQTENVTVSFDGFKALHGLNFSMDPGELRVVIGPNGAGKTTLLDVITGKVKPVEGRVLFKGTEINGLRVNQIINMGVGRKFQTPGVYTNFTAFENLELSYQTNRKVFSTLFNPLSSSDVEQIYAILEVIGLAGKANQKAGLLSHGEKQWLEIGMVIVQDPDLLLIDEPVAGMTEGEREKTVRLLQSIATDQSILVIEHDMSFVREIANKVTVLHEGMILCEGPMEKVQNDSRVIELYLGRGNESHASH